VRRFRVLMKKYWILDNGHACNMDQKIEQLQTLMTTPKPEKADAIVWLQGNMYDRGEKVLELYHAGYAPWIVVTGNNTRAVEDDNVKIHDIVSWLWWMINLSIRSIKRHMWWRAQKRKDGERYYSSGQRIISFARF